jgi:hypothetical protein
VQGDQMNQLNRYSIFFIILLNTSVFSFPGDQLPLSCSYAFGGVDGQSLDQKAAKKARAEIFAKGLSQKIDIYDITYDYTYATFKANNPSSTKTEEEYKEENRIIATKEYTDKIRAYHNPSKRVTKLGDSLSDFVDFYGMILPENNGMHRAAGGFGGLTPWYVDSWDDYMSWGAGIVNPAEVLSFQNVAVYGYTTIGVLSQLGIERDSTSMDNLDVVDTGSTYCLKDRPQNNSLNFQEGILAPGKSTTRSVLMIGGNDIFGFGIMSGTWVPFLNKRLVDFSLSNISMIVDWHLENGKKIFLEGTVPVFSATKEYTDKIRAYHNPSKRVTKLGDSLSDFVDFYGVIV